MVINDIFQVPSQVRGLSLSPPRAEAAVGTAQRVDGGNGGWGGDAVEAEAGATP